MLCVDSDRARARIHSRGDGRGLCKCGMNDVKPIVECWYKRLSCRNLGLWVYNSSTAGYTSTTSTKCCVLCATVAAERTKCVKDWLTNQFFCSTITVCLLCYLTKINCLATAPAACIFQTSRRWFCLYLVDYSEPVAVIQLAQGRVHSARYLQHRILFRSVSKWYSRSSINSTDWHNKSDVLAAYTPWSGWNPTQVFRSTLVEYFGLKESFDRTWRCDANNQSNIGGLSPTGRWSCLINCQC